jgi:hypothetical protein
MKKSPESNLLDYIPVQLVAWQENTETNLIVLLKPKFNNKILKKYFLPQLKNPNFRVNLDEYGSRVWKLIDGSRTVLQIAENLEETFGESVEPVYERVGNFMRSLENNKFIGYRD